MQQCEIFVVSVDELQEHKKEMHDDFVDKFTNDAETIALQVFWDIWLTRNLPKRQLKKITP
jgi:hypothetical protein